MSKSLIISSEENWMEGEAIRQLEHVAGLKSMQQVVGLPDLHPGKGIPIGAAFLSKSMIYPHLIGNDISCGMGLWQTDQKIRKFKLDKAVKKLDGFEMPWSGDARRALSKMGLPEDLWPSALGTIGSGNHFAEFQTVEEIVDEDIFESLKLEKDLLFLRFILDRAVLVKAFCDVMLKNMMGRVLWKVTKILTTIACAMIKLLCGVNSIAA